MTIAVCFQCGAQKFGAFCPCGECRAVPQTEDELALSLAMTDHYFDQQTLDQMGAAVRDGKPPHLSPETREGLLASLRRHGIADKLREMAAQVKPEDEAKGGRGTLPEGRESP
jgi:hypothetical protein